MDVFGASDSVTPLLRAGVHAGVEIRVVEHDRVRVEHVAHGRAATVGQDGTEEPPVAVKRLHLILKRGGARVEKVIATGYTSSLFLEM